MYDEDNIFEVISPQAHVIPLAKFLSISKEVVVIRLKQRPPGLKAKLQSLLNERLGVPYTFGALRLIMRRTLLLRYFRIKKPAWTR